MNHYELIETVKRVATNNNVTMVLDTSNEFFPAVVEMPEEQLVALYKDTVGSTKCLGKMVDNFPHDTSSQGWSRFKAALFFAHDQYNNSKPSPVTLCHMLNAMLAMVVASGQDRQILEWSESITEGPHNNKEGLMETMALTSPIHHHHILQAVAWVEEMRK